MSASSQPSDILYISGPSTCWRRGGICVGVGDLAPGSRLTKSRYVELLVELSSHEIVVVECDALVYRPVVEAVIVYKWLGYIKGLVFEGCCPKLYGVEYECV